MVAPCGPSRRGICHAPAACCARNPGIPTGMGNTPFFFLCPCFAHRYPHGMGNTQKPSLHSDGMPVYPHGREEHRMAAGRRRLVQGFDCRDARLPAAEQHPRTRKAAGSHAVHSPMWKQDSPLQRKAVWNEACLHPHGGWLFVSRLSGVQQAEAHEKRGARAPLEKAFLPKTRSCRQRSAGPSRRPASCRNRCGSCASRCRRPPC